MRNAEETLLVVKFQPIYWKPGVHKTRLEGIRSRESTEHLCAQDYKVSKNGVDTKEQAIR